MIMKKVLSLATLVVVLTTLFSCGNKTEQLQHQVDSLQSALMERDNDYSQLNDFLNVISDGLDSIAVQENSLLMRNPESPRLNREQMKRGLYELKETLKKQRERIGELEKDLDNGKGDVKKLRNVIAAMKQQIESKDAQINDLLTQLEESKISVDQLTERVSSLTLQTEEQQAQISQQEEMMQTQEQMMQTQEQALNERFIKIGTKQELKEAGLLSGGFMKKSKVDYSKIDRDLFQTVDIREVTEIPIPSKDPKLLTPVPEGSYTLQRNGKSTTLIITDAAKFWSVSDFLIIQN